MNLNRDLVSVVSEEREFYGDRRILLEGAIAELLSCVDMIRPDRWAGKLIEAPAKEETPCGS